MDKSTPATTYKRAKINSCPSVGLLPTWVDVPADTLIKDQHPD